MLLLFTVTIFSSDGKNIIGGYDVNKLKENITKAQQKINNKYWLSGKSEKEKKMAIATLKKEIDKWENILKKLTAETSKETAENHQEEIRLIHEKEQVEQKLKKEGEENKRKELMKNISKINRKIINMKNSQKNKENKKKALDPLEETLKTLQEKLKNLIL